MRTRLSYSYCSRAQSGREEQLVFMIWRTFQAYCLPGRRREERKAGGGMERARERELRERGQGDG